MDNVLLFAMCLCAVCLLRACLLCASVWCVCYVPVCYVPLCGVFATCLFAMCLCVVCLLRAVVRFVRIFPCSLGPLVKKVKDGQVEVIINSLCNNMFSDSESLRDISSVGMFGRERNGYS